MQVLEVIIGLVFVYLLLSLVCTAINELIAQWLSSRAVTLLDGIRTLLGGDSKPDVKKAKATSDESARVRGVALETLRSQAPAETAAYGTALAAQEDAADRDQVARSNLTMAQRAKEQAAAALKLLASAAAQLKLSASDALVRTTEAEYQKALTAAAATSAALATAGKALERADSALRSAAPDQLTRFQVATQRAREHREALAATERVAGIYAHPIIAGLSQVRRRWYGFGKMRLPSYIPPRAFSMALLDTIAPVDANGTLTLAGLRAKALKLPPAIGRPLLLFIDDAVGDLAGMRTNLERWYEDAMVRVSGLYKRKTQRALLVIALVVALATNADTIRIVRELATNEALRKAVVTDAEAYVSRDSTGQIVPASQYERIRQTVDTLQGLGIPIGWSSRPWSSLDRPTLSNVAGILLTALALSLGAPFWFDFLNKFVNIRSAGRAPEEKPKPPEALPPPRGA
jgi:hypothetical protein